MKTAMPSPRDVLTPDALGVLQAVADQGSFAAAARQLARQHVADDLHVAVAVVAEARAGGDAVLVDHAQVAEAHVLRIVVAGEGKAVEGLQPAVVGMAAFLGLAKRQHGSIPLNEC